jgi:putative GTP pyrophosphokinase
MAPPRRVPVTNSAADRAGERIREYFSLTREEQLALSREQRAAVVEAVVTVSDYRAMHATPMTSVTMGIRSMVRTVRRNDAIRPGQRFKRLDRILDKLRRYPRMRLSQMEDIGGCRVVLPTLGEVYSVLNRVRRNWPEASIKNYIAEPKDDGYRAIHVVKRRGGRLVEVQLRTTRQHDWAEVIEVYSPTLGFNLKDGEGPDDLREYFKLAAERLAREDREEPADPELEQTFARVRQGVLHYFQQN